MKKNWLYLPTAVLLVLCCWGAWRMVKLADEELREDMLFHAGLVNSLFNLNREISSDTAKFNPSKILELDLKNRVGKVLDQYPDCSYIYLLGRNADRKIFFLLDVGKRNDTASFGEIYDDASTELINVFDSGIPFVEGPLPDEWGVWVSALVPLRNPESGQIVGVLGMDIDASSWNLKVASKAALPVGALLLIVVVVFFYISQIRLRGEKARRMNEERFHELFDGSLLGLYRTTPNGEILMANPALVDMLKFSSFEELTRRNLETSGYDSQESRQRFLEILNQEGEVKGFESVWIRNDGSRVFVRENAKVIRNKAGKFQYFEGTVEDISEKQLTEAALVESERENKAMIEANPDLIFRIKRDGTITRFHAPKEELLFQAREKFLGRNIMEVLPLGVASNAMKAFEKAYHQKDVVIFEYQLQLGEHLLDFEDRIIAISDDETYSFIRDVTEQKQKAAQLIELNQQMVELVASRDKFFSIIAHDLKSPFNGILGFSNLILQDVEEKDYSKLGEYAENIVKTSGLTLNLLSNLLEWARMQTGAVKFNPEEFNLADVAADVVELYSEIALQKSISVNNKLQNHVSMVADKAMIGTILRNLVNNAIKFTNISGEIRIWVEQKNGETTVSVQDNGVGIPEKYICKLFNIEGNYSALGTMKEPGSGLGLVMCSDFVKKHNGQIWVESKLGVGTTFHFTIPDQKIG